MIQDFLKDKDLENLQADLCIIGGGAVGISVAMEYLDSNYSVILLEGGGLTSEVLTQKLYETQNKGLPHNNFEGRIRIFGGTTTKWAGQASPLDDIDFEKRDWVPYSGWPISKEEIKPYFKRVEKIMGLPHSSYDEDSWPKKKSLTKLDSKKFKYVYSQFSPKANFAQAYKLKLKESQNIKVILHANAVHIQLKEDKKSVDSIVYKNLKNKKGVVKAKYFVLCCGGIENPRLMLSSNDIQKEGVGNQNDLVGKFFQDHIHLHVAKVKPFDKEKIINQLVTFYKDNIRISPKIAFSEEMQRQEKTLNIAGDFYFKNDPDSVLQTLKDLMKNLKRGQSTSLLSRKASKIFFGLPQILKQSFRYFILNKPAIDTSGPIYLGVQVEPSPNPLSRITLTDELDALGMKKVCLNWQLSELDKKTIDVFIEHLSRELKKENIAELEILKSQNKINFPYDVFDSNHHMGTTRMAKDAKDGVVDEKSLVHGLENLYIGSPSVFPTTGFSNPTFNAIALSLRLSDQIKEKLMCQEF